MIVFFIPTSEFELDQSLYQITVFGHDRAYSAGVRGVDVAVVDPTEPLMMPPGEIFLAMPESR